jgi:hypothetical protein
MITKLDSRAFERLKKIHWFTKCAEPLDDTFKLSVERVAGWPTAIAHFTNHEWEDTTLQARNALTMYLSKRHQAAYQEWNRITVEARERIVAEIMPTIGEYQREQQLPPVFSDCVRWDLLGAVMEATYSDCRPPIFFSNLLEVYERGRFPCGWRGEWPNGHLLII